MGITINNCIDELEWIKSTGIYPYGNTQDKLHTDDYIDVVIDILHKYQQLEDFARWVAVEVIDEELWTYNHLSFAEIACRKLVKLGIMQESDGEYTYEVVEDGNVD